MGVAQANFNPVRGGAGDIIGWQVQWTLNTTNTTGQTVGSPIGDTSGSGAAGLGPLAGYADKSIQCEGTFGATATASLTGSNDGTHFHILTSPNGTSGTAGPASFTTAGGAGLMAITEAVIQMQPSLSGGDGTTSLVLTLFVRKTQTP